MPQYTSRLNLEKVGTTTPDINMSVQQWRTGLNGLSNSNMDKIDGFAVSVDASNTATNTKIDNLETKVDANKVEINAKVDKKLILNGEVTDTNFNLAQRQVVKDGLVGIYKGITTTAVSSGVRLPQNNMSKFFVAFNMNINLVGNGIIISDNAGRLRVVVGATSKVFNVQVDYGNGWVSVLEKAFNSYKFGSNAKFILYINNGFISLTIGNQTQTNTFTHIATQHNFGALNLLGNYNLVQELFGYVKDVFVYNRILTPTEIQHNFQVLDNSPSISKVETTKTQNVIATSTPLLYKISKSNRSVISQIPYTEVRDLVNYEYKFI